MQTFILTLLVCSVTLSAIALLYMAVSPYLTGRYSERGRYYAWLVIIVGLIVPFRPQWSDTPFSVEIPAAASLVQTNTEAPIHVMPPLYPPAITISPLENASVSGTTFTISWWPVVFMVWVAGLTVFVAYHGVKHYRFLKAVRRWSAQITDGKIPALLENLKSEMGIRQRIPIYLCTFVGSPMMVGIFKPRILLPTVDPAQEEIRFILKHELVHYKRKDLLYKYVVMTATALHWFNPVVYMMARSINVLCEMSCDAEVMKGADGDTRQTYGETVIGVAQHRLKLKTALSTHFYGGNNNMKNRIASIMDTRKKKAGIFIVCIIFMAVLITGGIFAVQAQGTAPDYGVQATAAPSRFEGLGFTDVLDLTDALEEIGLTFLHTQPFPEDRYEPTFCFGCGSLNPVSWCRRSPWIGRVSPEVPVRFASEADVDLMLEIGRLAIAQNVLLKWNTCVTDALYASDYYYHWRHNWRILTRPGRHAQLTYFATKYSATQLFGMELGFSFGNRPCILHEFHELGFFLDVPMEYVMNVARRYFYDENERCRCSVCESF